MPFKIPYSYVLLESYPFDAKAFIYKQESTSSRLYSSCGGCDDAYVVLISPEEAVILMRETPEMRWKAPYSSRPVLSSSRAPTGHERANSLTFQESNRFFATPRWEFMARNGSVI